MALIATAAAVVVVAAGAGVFFLLRPRHQHIHTTAQGGLSSPCARRLRPPGSASVPPTTFPAAADPGPAPTPSTVGSVTRFGGCGAEPAATAIATFVSQYFPRSTLIISRRTDSLLTPQQQQGQTARRSARIRSSADSNEILVAINPTANGDTAATLTFTSHQNASQAVGGTGTCTDWNITLFLEPNGTGYLIDQAPSTYHPKYKSCQ